MVVVLKMCEKQTIRQCTPVNNKELCLHKPVKLRLVNNLGCQPSS